jgi:hypothetical protein
MRLSAMEGVMGLDGELVEARELAHSTSVDFVANFSIASPEEGLRLIRDFLRIERADLRERIFEFVTEIASNQESGSPA